MSKGFVCGESTGSWPDVGNGETPCCEGSALDGPANCTCWEPVYDEEQHPPRTDILHTTRTTMCHDCAYRPGSPERRGDAEAAANAEMLEQFVEDGSPFWCHQGMRQPREWRHPTGATVPASPLYYPCPIVNGVPYKADGTPADLCGGWTALRLKHIQRGIGRDHSDTTGSPSRPQPPERQTT